MHDVHCRGRLRPLALAAFLAASSAVAATPDDIASLAVFLLSGESSQITGQTLHINGGKFLY